MADEAQPMEQEGNEAAPVTIEGELSTVSAVSFDFDAVTDSGANHDTVPAEDSGGASKRNPNVSSTGSANTTTTIDLLIERLNNLELQHAVQATASTRANQGLEEDT
ncbi:hypothetical protein BT69DRAFT_244835 [Atractiella rhizophila]|nr:hypothetical protein BT69DRAFT_244835 [Atractiella rhizophila]